MKLDEELCLCFHVTRRKVENYLRLHQPRVPSQLSQCDGAGTGCGWCRKILEGMWRAAKDPTIQLDLPEAEEHAAGRAVYRQERES
jgi:bacterioferritin-associated ferredoxin